MNDSEARTFEKTRDERDRYKAALKKIEEMAYQKIGDPAPKFSDAWELAYETLRIS